MLHSITFIIALLLATSIVAADEFTKLIGDFSRGRLAGWETKSFAGKTDYQLVMEGQRQVIRSTSHASASGLYRKVRIDLSATPYLNWSWKVEHTLGDIKERSKAGDDYPARIYVVVSGGMLFWKTRALNYVWSSSQPPNASWPNAYTDHAQMIAVRGTTDTTGNWHGEKRNIREDFKNYFGLDIRYIDAVALMTDTDNTGKQATAYYGDIFFTRD